VILLGPLTLVLTLFAARHEREDLRRPLDKRLVRRLFGYTRPYARQRNVLLFLVAVRAVQLPALGWLVAKILSGPIAHHDSRGTLRGVAAFAALLLATEVMFVFRVRLALRLGEAVIHDLRRDIFAHLLRMPVSFFHRTPLGRLISRVTSDVDSIRLAIQDCAFIGVVNLGCMAVAAVLMAIYDGWLFLVVLAMVPLLGALLRYFHGRLARAYRQMHESFGRVTATLAESVSGIRVIQGFGRQDITGGLFRGLIYDHSRYNLGVAQSNAIFTPLLEFNGQLFLAILLVVGGFQALSGRVSLESLIQFFFLANLFFNPIPVLATQYNQALAAMAGAERVFRLLDAEPDWQDEPGARALPALAGRVELRKVSFAYQPGKPVLHEVSLLVEPGQTVAIVGTTGGGKSTVMSLIAKFHLPTSGELLIDGHDVRTLSSPFLHSRMGNVLQSQQLFSGTVLDNLRVGRPAATEEEVRRAARALDVLDVFQALPRAFASEVGEKGANLSMGQRQIVCFTRALLADPRILLLDEATSGLDAVTEARLQRALRVLLRGRTSFVVAHRLSTIRHADQVLVMDHGRIVERGRYAELLRHDGYLARLHRYATGGHNQRGAAGL
jgi:ATP-binding cassette subfamily B protein